uniref:pseudouridine 5'-phosphatase n=2 Tax=Clastoptera arizonana TaxID=38151 RepID=A0A1B6DCE2_9HEMI
MTKFQPVTHVIFDLDGLLLNTEPLYQQTFHELVSKYGKEYTEELRLKVLGTRQQDAVRIIVDALQLPITYEEFSFKSKDLLHKAFSGNVGLMPGAEKLVRHLYSKKIPLAVATSSGKENVLLKTQAHRELFGCFSHIVMGSSDPGVKNGKPHPDIFLIAASRFADSPNVTKCLVLEDSPNGVVAAKAAGMQVVMVPDPQVSQERRKPATLVLNSLEEFKPEDFGLPPF